jgi:hypothetical protein
VRNKCKRDKIKIKGLHAVYIYVHTVISEGYYVDFSKRKYPDTCLHFYSNSIDNTHGELKAHSHIQVTEPEQSMGRNYSQYTGT